MRGSGGVVHVFSRMHPSGEQLALMTGVAAILRFPMPDLIDLADEDDSSSGSSDEESDGEFHLEGFDETTSAAHDSTVAAGGGGADWPTAGEPDGQVTENIM